METEALKALANLVRSQRVAALGTLREGAPLVSMVAYAVESDLGAFWLHLSQLALHTRSIAADARVALMVAESDTGERDPQTLSRVSIQGEAEAVPPGAAGYEAARSLYLSRFPEAGSSFALGDFSLYRIVPRRGRYVAGFGQIYNVTLEHFNQAAGIP